MNPNQFNITSSNSLDEFPLQIQIQVLVFGTVLNIKLNQQQGLLYNSSIYSQVNFYSDLNLVNTTQNLVRFISFKLIHL